MYLYIFDMSTLWYLYAAVLCILSKSWLLLPKKKGLGWYCAMPQITDRTTNNLVALPIVQCVNACQFSCPSKWLQWLPITAKLTMDTLS